ncbi:hypothetical protein JHK85_041768 [Glycine max]|nr:hypothetical protein JHK86_041162 [Glycine max]KAG4955388.1 hypothetical protein JHK85_041768 [Glycine max]
MARPGNKIIQAKLVGMSYLMVLLGDMGTGKTSIALRFVKGHFFPNQVYFHFIALIEIGKLLSQHNNNYSLGILTLIYAQEPTIGAAFFTQILSLSEATVKFDIWDTAGQERYHSLAPMYYRGNQKSVMALVANKSDLEPKREVEAEVGEQFAQENGMFYMETSAKTAENINELFYEIAKRLARALPPKPTGMNLNSDIQDRGRNYFCCSA